MPLWQARRQNGAAAASQLAAAAAAGDNSDEEVYATARAMDHADGAMYDSDDNLVPGPGAPDGRKIEPLPALDHANITYDAFEKDFYDEAEAISKLSLAEVMPFVTTVL